MKKRPIIYPVGKTEDGKLCLAGIYDFYATHGFPYEMSFESLYQQDIMPSWIHFYEEALAHRGSSPQAMARILSSLSIAIRDVWGPDFRDEVIRRLQHYIVWKESKRNEKKGNK